MEADEIIKNWKSYRCDPQVMVLAGMFKNKDDPRSDFQFTSDNFEFCASEIAKNALNVVLKPVLDVFYQMSNASLQSIGFTMNLRTLGANLFNGLNRMFEIFTRRFNLTFHELHMSFVKQFAAINKANAIAIASVYSGISVIRAIMNAFQLMIVVSISILVIMVVLVIFMFFIFAPVIPLILVAISVISATASAGAVGGMGSAFCFSKDTLILLNGKITSIDKVLVGDILEDGSTVTATMKFSADESVELYDIDGVIVSGSHIIYKNGLPVFVKDYEGAVKYNSYLTELYCLNTSLHKIPVSVKNGTYVFADWEELDDTSMEDWDVLIRKLLNNDDIVHRSNKKAYESESGFAKETLVYTQNGANMIRSLVIGDIVSDGTDWTEIIGIVRLAGSETQTMGKIKGLRLSGASWVNESGIWIRACESVHWEDSAPVKDLISVFTKSGKLVVNDIVARDFSDIGLEKIEKTYDFTFSRLLQKC
jgi:hypothetical protein